MTANERRAELMRILIARRAESAPQLARELGVHVNTIQRDILALTAEYPLETRTGNGGCVYLPDWYHPHRNILSNEQKQTLSQLMESANEQQAKVLRELLLEYGSPKDRQTVTEGTNVKSRTWASHKGSPLPTSA